MKSKNQIPMPIGREKTIMIFDQWASIVGLFGCSFVEYICFYSSKKKKKNTLGLFYFIFFIFLWSYEMVKLKIAYVITSFK